MTTTDAIDDIKRKRRSLRRKISTRLETIIRLRGEVRELEEDLYFLTNQLRKAKS